MISKNSSFWHFGITFCLENKSVCKCGFVFVMITEIFWWIFWRDNWQSLIVVVENFRSLVVFSIKYNKFMNSKLLNQPNQKKILWHKNISPQDLLVYNYFDGSTKYLQTKNPFACHARNVDFPLDVKVFFSFA